LGGLFASSESRKAALATSVCVCVGRSIDAFVCMEDRNGDEESIDSIRGGGTDGRTDGRELSLTTLVGCPWGVSVCLVNYMASPSL
jgi:hypothetical protein